MRSAAVCAVILVPLSAWASMTRSGSVQDKKRVYLTNLRRIDVDDWSLGGALLGAALAGRGFSVLYALGRSLGKKFM